MPRGHEQDPLYSLSFRNMVCHCLFLGKKVVIITSKHCTTIFFSLYDLLLGKQLLWEKMPRKARINTKQIYRNVLMPPGHSIILLKSNQYL